MKLERFLSVRDLNPEVIRGLLKLTSRIKASQIQKQSDEFSKSLQNRTVLQLFVENSTRTKISFEVATRRLGGASIGFAAASSSLAKGESLIDTAEVLRRYGADAIVVRHPAAGAAEKLFSHLKLPVINAGDGLHEHPTQALLDAFTLMENFGDDPKALVGKSILIVGDILHSRVARSNIHLLSKLGMKVKLCAPLTLLPSDLSAFSVDEVIHRLDDPKGQDCLSNVDAVMVLRIQFERQLGSQSFFAHVPSKEEYRKFWGLTIERARLLKKSAVILHPGPVNRGLEIDAEVADSSASRILQQVENGVIARMAVLHSIFHEVNA